VDTKLTTTTTMMMIQKIEFGGARLRMEWIRFAERKYSSLVYSAEPTISD